MAIALKGSTSKMTTGSTTEDITLPGSPAKDDICVLALALDSSSGSGWVNTAGWNNVYTLSGLPEFEVYWKRMGATPDTVVSVTAGAASRRMATVIQTWSGVDTTTALDVTSTTATGASGDPDPASITTVTDNAVVIAIGAWDDDTFTDAAAPSGYGDLIEQETTGAAANQGATVAMASKLVTSFGAENPGAFSGSGDDEWAAVTMALRPGASGTEISATTDALVLTEFAATLTLDVEVTASTDTLVLTEFAATVANDTEISATTDALVLTEFPATITYDVDVLATTDALVLTEFTATVANDTEIAATTDALVLTEFPATITYDVDVQASTDTLVLTEFAASIDRDITANTDTLVLTEFPATVSLTADTEISATTDTLVLTEFPATITYDVDVLATTDTLVLTEFPATVANDTEISATTDTLVLTELPATVANDTEIAATTDTLVLTEFPATITYDVEVTASTDTLVLTEFPASVDRDITASLDALVLTEFPVTITYDVDLQAGADTLVLTEFPASIDRNITATTDTLVLTEFPATVANDTEIAATTDALVLTEFPADVVFDGVDTEVAATTDALVLTEFPAAISHDVDVAATTDALVLTEFPVAITYNVEVTASVDTLVLTEFPTTISLDTNITVSTDTLILSTHAAFIGVVSTTAILGVGDQMLANRQDTTFPLEVYVDDTGGVVGLIITASLRDVADSTSYLDFDDLTFKTSGWVAKTKTLTGFGSGFYGTTVDFSAVTNLPLGHLSVEYSVSGAVTAVNSDIISFKDMDTTKIDELWKLQGLDSANPMTVTPTSRAAGAGVTQVISGDGENTSTVTRT